MTKTARIWSVTAALVLTSGLSAAPPVSLVLLLDNQQVLSGDVERVADQYRVRREDGVTLVPVGRVLTLCPNLDAAYEFLREKASARDADAHLRLAKWCDANGLRGRAAEEAKLAADLAPGRAIVQATYQQLQRKAAAPPPAQAAPAVLPASILSAAAEPIECGAEAYKRFATKVQPVLMNTCAACHAGTYAGKFRLERVYADGPNARPGTQRNLAASLSLIDRARPAASPLLQQATAAHGGAALPPLRDRGVPAFKQLDEWVKLAVSDTSAPPAPPPSTPAGTDADVVGSSAIAPNGASKSDFGSGGSTKDAAAESKDPFDPAIFNRQYHPAAAQPKPAPARDRVNESPSGPSPAPAPR